MQALPSDSSLTGGLQEGVMKPGDRLLLRLLIETAILVRRGEVITEAVAEERARNLTVIIEGFIAELDEDKQETAAQQHADRIIT